MRRGGPVMAAETQAGAAKPFFVSYKKGGATHDDETQDKALFNKLYKEKEAKEKYARGGSIKQGGGGSKQFNEPGGYPVMKNAAGGGLGRLEKRGKGVRK
jgi:hypothetical protein